MKPPKPGDRIVLVSTVEKTKLTRGAKGTVMFIGPLGKISVLWDSGKSKLALIPGRDKWRIIKKEGSDAKDKHTNADLE